MDHDSEQDSQLPATDDAQSAFADHRISTPPQSPSKGGYLTRLLIFLALAFGVAPAIVGTLVRIFHASFSTADPITLLWLDAGNFAFILALSAAMAVFEHRQVGDYGLPAARNVPKEVLSRNRLRLGGSLAAHRLDCGSRRVFVRTFSSFRSGDSALGLYPPAVVPLRRSLRRISLSRIFAIRA